MDLRFSEREERFRQQARDWLEANLVGEFAVVQGRGGPGDEHSLLDERRAWERHVAAAGWSCIGWPVEHGGRGASLTEQVIWAEEYARARAPGRMGHIGETLIGPAIIAYGSEAQKQRFLAPIRNAEEFWCQGYSEPNAGSDLANVQTRAELDGERWRITGQKVWTSLAEWSQWCFVLCRTDDDATRHKGLSMLLVPMEQQGVTIRPIRQLTGTSEFAEVFFDGARTPADHIVGAPGDGWKVALGTLAFERGVSTLSQQLAFAGELTEVRHLARVRGLDTDPVIRQRLADASIGLDIMRLNALRMLSELSSGELSGPALINKL